MKIINKIRYFFKKEEDNYELYAIAIMSHIFLYATLVRTL